MTDCHFCHQHKVNGPNKATCEIVIALLDKRRPCCTSCSRKFSNSPFSIVVWPDKIDAAAALLDKGESEQEHGWCGDDPRGEKE